jgi:hypothetical protein
MRFWTSTGLSALDPKRKHLFFVEMDLFASGRGNPMVWWAKSVEKPNIKFQTNSSNAAGKVAAAINTRAGGMKIQSLDAVEQFDPIEMTLVDPNILIPNKFGEARKKQTTILMELIDRATTGAKVNGGVTGFTRQLGEVRINQMANVESLINPATTVASTTGAGVDPFNLDPEISQTFGNLAVSETWTLYNPYFTAIDFGSLDYSDENLVEIKLSLGYTGFSLSVAGDNRSYTIGSRTISTTRSRSGGGAAGLPSSNS